jgi:hypothetical protein
MPLRSKQRLVLVKTEASSYGVNSSPTGSNALFINDDLELSQPAGGGTTQRRIIRPYRGAYETLIVNSQVGITFSVELAGSGTAGTAPAYADLLRACGLAQTVTGTALTGTAAAGAAGSITLAAGTSAVNDFYVGQIVSITSGTGSGSAGVITAYNGTTKVATVSRTTAAFAPAASSQYSIGPNVSFRPISIVDGVADTSCTIVYNVDGVQHVLLGCRGTATINATLGEIPSISFTMTGIYTTPTDTAQSTYTLAYANQAPPVVFKSDAVSGYNFFGVTTCLQSVQLDVGNEVVYKELIGCGKRVDIVDGQTSGTVMMEATTMATWNPFEASLTDNAPGRLSVVHGPTAGNRVSVVVPRVDLGQPTYARDQGTEMINVPFTALPSVVGNDDFYLVYS